MLGITIDTDQGVVYKLKIKNLIPKKLIDLPKGKLGGNIKHTYCQSYRFASIKEKKDSFMFVQSQK